MEKIVFLAKALAVAVMVAGVSAATAESDAAQVGILDHVFSVPFEPKQVILIKEYPKGLVRMFNAECLGVKTENPGKQEASQVLCASKVDLNDADEDSKPFQFSFIVKGRPGEVFGSKISKITDKEIVKNTRTQEEYAVRKTRLEEKIVREQAVMEQLGLELKILRVKASQVAGVSDIVSVRGELSSISSGGERLEQEKRRLETLVKRAQELPDPVDINTRRKALSLDLKEAAKVTAMADRLNRRRKEAATGSLNDKLAMIKEAESVDIEALGQEVVRLREKRKQLEARFGVAPKAEGTEF